MQMTEFKPTEGISSAPLGLTGVVNGNPNDVQWVSEGNVNNENKITSFSCFTS